MKFIFILLSSKIYEINDYDDNESNVIQNTHDCVFDWPYLD